MSVPDDINILSSVDIKPSVAEVFEEVPPSNAASSTGSQLEDRCAGSKAREEGVLRLVPRLKAATKEVEPRILDGNLFGCCTEPKVKVARNFALAYNVA